MKKETQLWANLLFNVVLPALVLAKMSVPERLGPQWAFGLALVFPLSFGIFSYVREKKHNIFSMVGLFSITLTGSLGLIKAEGHWFAIKDALVPTCIGTALLISLKAKKPLIELLLLNETIVDRPRIDSALTDQGKTLEYQKLIVASTYRTALVFVYSASVHFAISFMTLKSPTGTPEFNAELARVTTLVWPLITLPAMIFNGFTLWKLVSGIRSLTGLKLEEILRTS